MAGVRRPRLGFRARVTARWTAGFSLLLAILLLVTYGTLRSMTYADLDRHLRTLAATEAASSTDGPVNPHVHELPVLVLAGGTFTEKVVQVFDRNKRVIAASPERAREVTFVPTTLVDEALAGDAPVTTTTLDGVPMRLVVVRMLYGEDAYAIAVAVNVSEHLATLARVRDILALVWVLGTAATAAMGFLLASHVLRPVRALTERAMDIADSGLGARLETTGPADDVSSMTASLNALLARLQVALEANRRFAADAAHELRSPVTAIAGEIDVALRRERGAGEYRETLTLVRQRLDTLSSLIEDLLILVRAQEGHDVVMRQELNLPAQVQASVNRFAQAAWERDVEVQAEGLDGLRVYGEAGLLSRVLDNVIDNAIRYNRRGGRVTIRAAVEPAASDAWAPDQVVLSVADTGHGIPADAHARVFDRFYRLDSSRARGTGGTGLGLAIAREVMGLLQGSIVIAGSSDAGTTLDLRLAGHRAPDPKT